MYLLCLLGRCPSAYAHASVVFCDCVLGQCFVAVFVLFGAVWCVFLCLLHGVLWRVTSKKTRELPGVDCESCPLPEVHGVSWRLYALR